MDKSALAQAIAAADSIQQCLNSRSWVCKLMIFRLTDVCDRSTVWVLQSGISIVSAVHNVYLTKIHVQNWRMFLELFSLAIVRLVLPYTYIDSIKKLTGARETHVQILKALRVPTLLPCATDNTTCWEYLMFGGSISLSAEIHPFIHLGCPLHVAFLTRWAYL